MKRPNTALLRLCVLSLFGLALAGCASSADAPRQKSGVEVYGEIDVGVGVHR